MTWRSGDLAIGGCAAAAVGVGIWCSLARLDVATVGGVRVAMFPPWWGLAAAIAGAFVVIAALRPKSSTSFFLPLVFALPYLPWLPDVFPVLRAFAGPGRWIVWVIIGVVAFERAPTVRVTALVVFIATTVIVGGAAVRLTGTALYPGGDEPHYLIITQSLLGDGDLKIENNHLREDYAPYFRARLAPHYLARGVDGQIYSVHPIGLPIVVAPAFAIAGYRGVLVFLVLVASLVATLVWRHALALTESAAAAAFAWAATCLTSPFLFNAFAVYPEVCAAACVLLAMPTRPQSWDEALASSIEDERPLRWLARGVAIAALPWLSSKYVLMAFVLAAIGVWHARRVHRIVLVVAPLALSLAGWFAFFYLVWGSPLPSAAYGGNTSMEPSTLLRGAPGLWLDQEYGLIPYAPVLLLVFPGLVRMWREGRRSLTIEIVLVFGSLLATVGAFHIWWGGSAAPGRPVVAALPLLAIPVAWQFRSAEGRGVRRAAQLALLTASLGISTVLLFAQEGLLLANERSGTSRLFRYLSISGELPRILPSFIAQSSDRGSAPDRTSSIMLDSFDASRRPVGVVYDPIRRIPVAEIPARFPLVAAGDVARARWSLPAGYYRVHLQPFDEISRTSREFAVTVGRQKAPLVRWPLPQVDPTHIEFDLPVDVGWIGFQLTPSTGVPPQTVRVVPLHVVDASRRQQRQPVVEAASYPRLQLFFHDGNAYPEPGGFWTRGSASSLVTVRPLSGGGTKVRIHCGPIANQVQLRADNWEETREVASGAAVEVSLPPEPPILRVQIQTVGGFTPASRDPSSNDRRFLGCWIEPF